jgi:hypothetical protein
LALHSQRQQVQPVAELEPVLRLLGQELEQELELELEQELVQQRLAQRLLQHHH